MSPPSLVISTASESPSLTHLDIEPPREGLLSFTTPGQYAILSLPNFKEGYFAMSSAPGATPWSFLIKKSSPFTEKLASLKKGDEVNVSAAMGRGFDGGKMKGKDILLLGVGSGIAPLRSAILWMIPRRKSFGTITLYYGCRHEGDFAYAKEWASWKRKGMEVIPVLSRGASTGFTGYVQHHLPQKMDSDTVALLCGTKEMMADATQTLLERGMAPDNILKNY